MKEGVFPEDRSGVLARGQRCLEELPPRSRAWGSLSPVAGCPWGKAQDEATALGQSRRPSSFGEPSAGAGRPAGPMCVDAGGKRGPWEGESPVRGSCSSKGDEPPGAPAVPEPLAPPSPSRVELLAPARLCGGPAGELWPRAAAWAWRGDGGGGRVRKQAVGQRSPSPHHGQHRGIRSRAGPGA